MTKEGAALIWLEAFYPLLGGFMAPEAYTLEAALSGWLRGEAAPAIKDRAARAYHQYQKCGLTAARRLFYADE